MKEKHHELSKNFDPHHAIYALKGISWFLHDYYSEGPGVYRTVPAGHHANLLGISWLQQRLVNELYEYIAALDEAGIELPVIKEFFEGLDCENRVSEARECYLVN